MKSPLSNCIQHLHSADGDLVGAELNVLIFPGSEGGFVAQGIEIDYTASGETEELARDHFARGFCATIISYIQRGRDLAGLFKTPTPREYVQAYFSNRNHQIFSCAVELKSSVSLPDDAPIPERLNFMQVKAVA